MEAGYAPFFLIVRIKNRRDFLFLFTDDVMSREDSCRLHKD